MNESRKHTEGFTLAELLLTVAIVMILAAMALPSLISAQNNLRVFELDNAAESIANAAQANMTAQKNAGTWVDIVKEDDGSYKADFPAAVSAAASDDLRYMTADTARDKGVVTGLSIDQSVRDGSYVIEFDAGTASVTRVFYTDGKTGFFGDPAPANDQILAYYTRYGSSNDSRALRISNDTGVMVGLYEGTPAGATNAYALADPVVRADDDGKLCVRDPNMVVDPGKTPRFDTTTDVTVFQLKKDDGGKLKETGVSFSIEGLHGQDNLTLRGTYSDGSSQDVEVDNVPRSSLRAITLDNLTGEYAIDLNALVDNVKELAGEDGANKSAAALVEHVLAAFKGGDSIRADAVVQTQEPCIPATATAFMEWPTKVPRISLYITNPSTTAYESGKATKQGNVVIGKSDSLHIGGTYKLYEPELETASKDPIVDMPASWAIGAKSYEVTTHSEIAKYNVDEKLQAYLGGSVELSEALGKKVNVKATASTYTTPEGASHQYQISEIWLGVGRESGTSGFERVGYLSKNEWKWQADEDGKGETLWASLFKECVDFTYDGDGAIVAAVIDSEKMNESWNIAPDEQSTGYEIYVRTTPKLDEVHGWFTANMNEGSLIGNDAYQGTGLANYNSNQYRTSIVGYLGKRADTTGSRGQRHGWGILQPFENEFGAPSTVALWQVTNRQGLSITWSNGEKYPDTGDVRVYYSSTPAVPWGNGSYTEATITNALPSAALWLYKKGDGYKPSPQALVQGADAATNDFHLVASESADFEIPYGSNIKGSEHEGHDDLFYRALQYQGADGKTVGKIQYVPYTVQDDEDVAAVREYTGDVPNGKAFDGWETYDKTGKATGIKLQPGDVVGDYNKDLPLGAVTLKPTFRDASFNEGIGLVYVDKDAEGNLVAYGYGDGKEAEQKTYELKGSDKGLVPGTYYLVIPRGHKDPTIVSGALKIGKQINGVSIPGNQGATLCALAPSDALSFEKIQTVRVAVNHGKDESLSRIYYLNTQFARALSMTRDAADNWGTSTSPWNVSRASQFPGSQSAAVQKTVKNDCFLQISDIDFKDVEGAYQGFLSAFTGSYDGADFVMKAAELAIGSIQYDGSSTDRAAGLFPVTNGATLAGIRMELGEADDTITYEDGKNPVVYFGALTGYASSTSIKNCTVASAPGKSTTFNLHSLRSANGVDDHYNAVGALAGRTVGSTTIAGCTARGITLSLQTESDTWNSANSRNYFGGLVGVADLSKFAASDKPLRELTVDQVSVRVEQSTLGAGKEITLGGVVGRLWVDKNAYDIDESWKWSVSGLSIVADLGLSRDDVSKRIYVGSAIGNLATNNANVKAICSGLAKNEGNNFTSNEYKRDLTARGPLYGRIPGPGAFVDERAGLVYVGSASDGAWSAYGYAKGDAGVDDLQIKKADGSAADLEAGGYYMVLPAGMRCSSTSTVNAEPLTGDYLVSGEKKTLVKVTSAQDTGNRYEAVSLNVDDDPDQPITHTFYVNFNFANAVTSDEEIAKTWGTDARPWQVALPTQFPGALPKAVQDKRLGDSFVQTADLSFADFASSGTYVGMGKAFTGTYDGNGFSIGDFAGAVTGCTANSRTQQGLFPLAQKATLKNIRLLVSVPAQGAPNANIVKGADKAVRFGLLVGSAENQTVIDSCSVVGAGWDKPTDKVKLTVESVYPLCLDMGVMAGTLSDSVMVNCSTSNIDLSIEFASGDRSGGGNQLNMGGLVGYATGDKAAVSSCQANVIGLSTNQLVKNSYIRGGGLVGYIENGATLAETHVGPDGKTVITYAKDILITYMPGQSPDRAMNTTGGLVGRWYGKNSAGADNAVKVFREIEERYQLVRYRLGTSGQETDLASWYGNGDGAIVPSIDEIEGKLAEPTNDVLPADADPVAPQPDATAPEAPSGADDPMSGEPAIPTVTLPEDGTKDDEGSGDEPGDAPTDAESESHA